MFKRIVAIVTTSLVGVTLVAVPSQAAPSSPGFCAPVLDNSRLVHIQVTPLTGAGEPFTGVVTVTSSETGDDWLILAEDTPYAGQVEFDVDPIWSAPGAQTEIRVSADGMAEFSCTADYYPFVDYPEFSGVTTVDLGETSVILAHATATPKYGTALMATLEVFEGNEWVAKETVATIVATGDALLQYKPKAKQLARIAYDLVGSGVHRRIGTSIEFFFDVRYRTATVTSKPTSVVQSKSAAITVRYGTSATSGTAKLQRKSGSTWVTVSTVALTSGAAKFSYKPTATLTYRAYVTPTGEPAKATASFAITYLPAVSVKAPASVKKNATATFTVYHRLAKSGSGYLQVKSGSTWKTVKKFTLKSTGSTNTTLKITKSATYRVKVGSYASASATVKVK